MADTMSPETKENLTKMYTDNEATRTTAEEQTAGLNAATQAAYDQTKIEQAKAQNQFAQNQAANQVSALDAIRRSNASAIANGANAGLAAANELSSILGLQAEGTQAATDLANANIDAAAQLQADLKQNAVEGQKMANEVNATVNQNNAAIGANMAASDQAEAEKYSADKAAETQNNANTTIVTSTNPDGSKSEFQISNTQLEANRQAITNNLTNFNAGWATGDGQTFATEYWDPWANEGKGGMVSTGANQNNQAGGTASDMKKIATKIQAELDKAYASGDLDQIRLWESHATNFVSKIKTENDACLIPGTLITLASGITKPVEEITDSDTLLVWDFKHGCFSCAPVMFNDVEEKQEFKIVKLYFSNNTNLDITGEHGFFDLDLLKFIYIHSLEEAKQYIGHRFLYVEDEYEGHEVVELISVEGFTKITEVYSPCTAKYLCLYANGILTMPGNTEPFTNQFKIESEKLKYELESYVKDLETYGLATIKDFDGLVSENVFEAFQGQYLKVSLGKGLTNLEEISRLIERYSKYLNKM